MTRKEMITACVEDQIARGIVKAENKTMYEENEKKRQAKEIEDFYNFITSKEWKEWPISTDSER